MPCEDNRLVCSKFWNDTHGSGQWLTPDEVVFRASCGSVEIGRIGLFLRGACQKMGRGSRQVGASLLQKVSSSVLTSCVPPPPGLQLQPLPSCSCSIALRCIALAPVCRGWTCVLSRLSSCPECAAWPSCCYPIEGSNIRQNPYPGIGGTSHLPHRSFDVKLHLLSHERPHLERKRNILESYAM